MEDVAQLVRAQVCGSWGRGFETHLPPYLKKRVINIQLITLFSCAIY